MKIGHVALYTKDLEREKIFYEMYFGAKANPKYINSKTGLQTYFMSFEDGARLEIMTRPDINVHGEVCPFIGWAHLAFHMDSREEVDHLTQRLASNGVPIISNPRTTGDGYYESCIEDPDGNLIELVG